MSIVKPNVALATMTVPDWNPSEAQVSEPTPAKQASGWVLGEKPPRKVFNWFWKTMSKWTQWSEDSIDDINLFTDKAIKSDVSTLVTTQGELTTAAMSIRNKHIPVDTSVSISLSSGSYTTYDLVIENVTGEGILTIDMNNKVLNSIILNNISGVTLQLSNVNVNRTGNDVSLYLNNVNVRAGSTVTIDYVYGAFNSAVDVVTFADCSNITVSGICKDTSSATTYRNKSALKVLRCSNMDFTQTAVESTNKYCVYGMQVVNSTGIKVYDSVSELGLVSTSFLGCIPYSDKSTGIIPANLGTLTYNFTQANDFTVEIANLLKSIKHIGGNTTVAIDFVLGADVSHNQTLIFKDISGAGKLTINANAATYYNTSFKFDNVKCGKTTITGMAELKSGNTSASVIEITNCSDIKVNTTNLKITKATSKGIYMEYSNNIEYASVGATDNIWGSGGTAAYGIHAYYCNNVKINGSVRIATVGLPLYFLYSNDILIEGLDASGFTTYVLTASKCNGIYNYVATPIDPTLYNLINSSITGFYFYLPLNDDTGSGYYPDPTNGVRVFQHLSTYDIEDSLTVTKVNNAVSIDTALGRWYYYTSDNSGIANSTNYVIRDGADSYTVSYARSDTTKIGLITITK